MINQGNSFSIDLVMIFLVDSEADSCPGPAYIILDMNSSHEVASPMYGINNYADDLECTWLIIAPEGMVSHNKSPI